jgi:DNA 3'-phosphatase
MASTAHTKEESAFRKPGIGLWKRVLELMENNIDLESSFYCGDAAGRKTDHSNDDLLFAKNAKLKFYTPEEYFLG